MKYQVTEVCIGCGLCVETCPAVFCMGDDGFAEAVHVPVGEEDKALAREAMENCPVSAIEEENAG